MVVSKWMSCYNRLLPTRKLYLTHIHKQLASTSTSSATHPEEGVQRSILHELRDDHDGPALGDHALETDDIRVVKLAHDAGLRQEVPPLLLRVARLQCLDGYVDLPLAWQFQTALVHLPKLT